MYSMLGKACPSKLLAGSYDEFCGLRDCASQLLLQPLKLKRDTSHTSIHSTMSAEEVQRAYDMLQPSDNPLNLEEIASIVSGSMSLVDGGSSDEDFDVERRSYRDRRLDTSATAAVEGGIVHPLGAQLEIVLTEKKKALQDKLKKRSEDYKKIKANTERAHVLRVDSTELDGVHVFRHHLHTTAWKSRDADKPRSVPKAAVPTPTTLASDTEKR